MTIVRFDVVLWMDSGLPEDYAVNTWHINTTADDPLVGTQAFQADLTAFYTAIDQYLSSALEGTAAFRAYDLSDPSPRVPFIVDGAALTPGTDQLPAEVALCLSYQAARVSGLPQARRRGRVFIGPLASSAANLATGRPSDAFRTALVNAADALLTDSTTDPSYTWVAHSPTNMTSAAVDNGWVDNAFDTQRRRGIAPSTRSAFS